MREKNLILFFALIFISLVAASPFGYDNSGSVASSGGGGGNGTGLLQVINGYLTNTTVKGLNISSVIVGDGTAKTLINLTDPYLTSSDNNGNYVFDAGENLTSTYVTCDLGGSCKKINNWYLNSTPIMLANLPFEGDSNTLAKDFSGRGNNGLVTNAIFNATGGHDGYGAYEFSKDTEYINLTNNNGFSAVNEFSISMWYKRRDGVPIVSDLEFLFDRSLNGGSAERVSLLLFNRTGHLRLEFEFGKSTTPTKSNTNLEGYIDDGNWHHIVAVKTKGGVGKYYVDGAPNGTELLGILNATSFNDGRGSIIGARYDLAAHWVNGTLDDYMIFNRSLSAQEAKAIYDAGIMSKVVSQEIGGADTWYSNITNSNGTDVGTGNLTNALTVGDALINQSIQTNVSLYVNGDGKIEGDLQANSFITTSDERLKSNFQQTNHSTSELENLRIGSFDIYGRASEGILAQELRSIAPDTVVQSEDGYLRVRMEVLMGRILSWIKDLHFQNKKQLREIQTIKTETCLKDNSYSWC